MQVQSATVAIVGEGDAKRLVAYMIPEDKTLVSDDAAETEMQELIGGLRDYCITKLPGYMVPSAFMVLESWPLTANGKLDRTALPEMGESALVRVEYEAPEGKVEELLAKVWQELLNVDRVGRHDDFFALGGHSLLVVRLVNQVRSQLDIDLPLRYIFELSALTGLAYVCALELNKKNQLSEGSQENNSAREIIVL